MRISRAGIELIMRFEGFSSTTVRVDDQRWIIGYGHVRSDKDQYRVSKDEAEQILKEYDLPPFEQLILENTYTPLHQGAFDALVSFAFNIGKDAFLSSDVLSLLNAGDKIAAAEAMGSWRKARVKSKTIIVDALVRRRAAEVAMFLADPSGPAPAPSALVKPIQGTDIQAYATGERSIIIESKGGASNSVSQMPESERRTDIITKSAPRSLERLTRRIDDVLSDSTDLPEQEVYVDPSKQNVIDPNAGPTPEEITAAISELVKGGVAQEDSNTIEEFPGIDIEDLPSFDEASDDYILEDDDELEPYPGLDFVPINEARDGERFERTLGAKIGASSQLDESSDSLVIDDLETAKIDDQNIDRAVRLHEEMEAEMRRSQRLNWGPFAFLAVLGMALFSWGLSRAQNTGSTDATDVALITAGALLFLVMSYYFVREFVNPKK